MKKYRVRMGPYGVRIGPVWSPYGVRIGSVSGPYRVGIGPYMDDLKILRPARAPIGPTMAIRWKSHWMDPCAEHPLSRSAFRRLPAVSNKSPASFYIVNWLRPAASLVALNKDLRVYFFKSTPGWGTPGTPKIQLKNQVGPDKGWIASV